MSGVTLDTAGALAPVSWNRREDVLHQTLIIVPAQKKHSTLTIPS